MAKTHRLTATAGSLLVLLAILLATCAGCIAIQSDCKPCAAGQVQKLEEQCKTVQAEIRELREQIMKVQLDSGTADLKSSYRSRQIHVAKLEEQLFDLEQKRAECEGEVIAHETGQVKMADSEERWLQIRLILEQTKAKQERMRELLATEQAAAIELGRKYAIVQEKEEQLSQANETLQRLQKRIDQLLAVPNPRDKDQECPKQPCG